jgi:hypothetical protein
MIVSKYLLKLLGIVIFFPERTLKDLLTKSKVFPFNFPLSSGPGVNSLYFSAVSLKAH